MAVSTVLLATTSSSFPACCLFSKLWIYYGQHFSLVQVNFTYIEIYSNMCTNFLRSYKQAKYCWASGAYILKNMKRKLERHDAGLSHSFE